MTKEEKRKLSKRRYDRLRHERKMLALFPNWDFPRRKRFTANKESR